MKILIACDMEGITGVTRWEHCDPTHPEYQRFRKQMTMDVNAAVEGAFAGGVEEVQIADGHSQGQNLLIEELDSRAQLNCGTTSPWSMMNGIDSAFGGVFFIGYHAMAGTANAILAHTWSTQILNWKINGQKIGEFGMNALIAGWFNVPALMVSGDQSLATEALRFVPDIDCAVVKEANGYFSGKCFSPAKTHERILECAQLAVQKKREGRGPQPLKMNAPYEVEVEFTQPYMAETASRLTGSERTGGRSVTITVPDIPAAFLAARTLCNLAV